MNREDFRILFMDDEVNVTGSAQLAYETLKEAGYQINKCERMSPVLDSYYQEYYHLYILDIDMQKVTDVVEGTGMTVGEILKRLNSMSEVLIFSALGKVEDWFEAANYHFRGYVHKEEGPTKLLEKVDSIREGYDQKTTFSLKDKDKGNGQALIYWGNQEIVKKEQVTTLIQEKDLEPIYYHTLDEVLEALRSTSYSLILFLSSEVSGRIATMEKIKEIINQEPNPHVIMALEGDEPSRHIILSIVNMRPFRFLDLTRVKVIDRLQESIEAALIWYGREEVYEFPQHERLVHTPISEEEMEDLLEEERNVLFDWEEEEIDE